MISQNANDTVTELSYDNLGRILTLEELEGTTTFTYDTKDNGVGKLAEITSPDSVQVEFTYDTYSRLTSKTESIGSIDLTETKVYDRYGRDSLLVYPSGFAIKYIYNNNSYLSQIKRTSDNSLIWQANSMNARDQITGSTYGNNLVSQFSYDHGYVTGIKTGTIQHLQYGWDLGTGNLSWRKDSIRDMTENFSFDNLNRLTEITFGENVQNFTYSSNGNITSSTTAGSYTYDQDKPHAVTLVTNLTDVADTTDQALEYTSFNKVKNIIQGSKELDIWYGANRQRVKTVFSDSAYQLTKYFAHGNYEKEVGDENRELHYIMAGTGIAAIMQRKNSVDSMFYVHPDHLGSLVLITDENGNLYEEKSFDAFGRMRDPEDWSETVNGDNNRFDRGYTGHEHLSAFGLINMNGRMYDPHTARFLSPDLFVQNPTFTQSFNRYSYCVNNPLRFVDPGGYLWRDIFPDNWPRRGEQRRRHNHLDGSGGYQYDPSSYTGYRSSDGREVLWNEVYYNYIIPNTISYYISIVDNNETLFRGVHFSGGGTWYTEDGWDALVKQIGGMKNNSRLGNWWNTHWTAKFIPDVLYFTTGSTLNFLGGGSFSTGYALQLKGKEGIKLHSIITLNAKTGIHFSLWSLNIGFSSFIGDSRNFSFMESFKGVGTIGFELDYIFGISSSRSPSLTGEYLYSYSIGIGYGAGVSYNIGSITY